MLGRLYERENCSAARALEIVGERWSLLLVRDALVLGARHFSDFEQSLGIAPNILSSRLATFVDNGIMERHADDSGGQCYVLTDKGREFGVVLLALAQWGDKWAAPHGPPLSFRHADCGGKVSVTTECDSCSTAPDPQSIAAEVGPGADNRTRERLDR